jgi:hypothetical protein
MKAFGVSPDSIAGDWNHLIRIFSRCGFKSRHKHGRSPISGDSAIISGRRHDSNGECPLPLVRIPVTRSCPSDMFISCQRRCHCHCRTVIRSPAADDSSCREFLGPLFMLISTLSHLVGFTAPERVPIAGRASGNAQIGSVVVMPRPSPSMRGFTKLCRSLDAMAALTRSCPPAVLADRLDLVELHL